jgi:hypothetical protein
MSIIVMWYVVADIQYRPPKGIHHWLSRHGQRPTHLATRRQITLYPRCQSIHFSPIHPMLIPSLAVYVNSLDLPDCKGAKVRPIRQIPSVPLPEAILPELDLSCFPPLMRKMDLVCSSTNLASLSSWRPRIRWIPKGILSPTTKLSTWLDSHLPD